MNEEAEIFYQSSPHSLRMNPFLIAVDVLSILGCLFTFITTFAFGSFESMFVKMVLALLSMDLIANSIGLLLLPIQIQNVLFCHIAAFFSRFGYGGSIFWICCFAHSVYISVKDAGLDLSSFF